MLKKKQKWLLGFLLVIIGLLVGYWMIFGKAIDTPVETPRRIKKEEIEETDGSKRSERLSKSDIESLVNNRCAMCHDIKSPTRMSIYPVLSGQHADYLRKQLNDFKGLTDIKRHNELMQAVAVSLRNSEIEGISIYFASLLPRQAEAIDSDLLVLGRHVWRAGNKSVQIPSCMGCHGPTGQGIPGTFPRLAGQYTEYTRAQLAAFRNENRNNDLNHMMQAVTQRMTDKEIASISNFLEGLR